MNSRRPESEFKSLDPAHQLRIRRTLIVCGVWLGFVLASAGVFVASKPYLDKKREERLAQPGYVPKVTPKDLPKPPTKRQD